MPDAPLTKQRKISRMQPQGWIEKDALANLEAGADPLAAICGRARAERGGQEYVETAPPLALTPAPLVTKTPPHPGERSVLELLFAANAERSGAAVKILLVVLQKGETTISTSAFMQATGLKSNNTVLCAIRECLDWGWLERTQVCPRCLSVLPETEERIVGCAGCGRQISPEARYTVLDPTARMQNSQTGMQNMHMGLEIVQTGMQETQTPPMQNLHTDGMQKSQTVQDRINRIIGHQSPQDDQEGVQKSQTGMQKVQTPRTRADSDSLARIRDSDSRIPPSSGNGETGRVVYASAEWQQRTEKLAKDSARRIGDKSVGFHVKVWAHGRKVDWEQGGRRFEEGLLAIAQELEGKHNNTGKSQGAMWTKMVRRYFEEKGCPLLTEAETEEWKELHGSYQPPTL